MSAQINLLDEIIVDNFADRMVFNQDTNMVMVYNGQALVACVDVSVVITAHISDKEK